MAAIDDRVKPLLPQMLANRLSEAQKRLNALEGTAQKVLRSLVVRSRSRRRDLSALTKKLNPSASRVRKQLGEWRMRLVSGAGLASSLQLTELSREVSRISRKLDALSSKKSSA